MGSNDSQLEDLKNRLNTLQGFVIAVLVLVCLGLVLQAALAIYHRFFKKQKKQEAPTNVVVKSTKKSGDSSKKSKSNKKSSIRSMKTTSASTKSQKSSKHSKRSSRSSNKSTSSKRRTSTRGSSSKTLKSEKSDISKKVAVDVSIDKDDKKIEEKKMTSAPPSLELNIADPPPYSATNNQQESAEKASGSVENVPKVEKVEDQKAPDVPIAVTPMATAMSPAPPPVPVPVQAVPPPAPVLQQQFMAVPAPVEIPSAAVIQEKMPVSVPRVSLAPSSFAPPPPVPPSVAPSVGRAVPSLSLASSMAPGRNTWL